MPTPVGGYRSLQEGQKVEFDIGGIDCAQAAGWLLLAVVVGILLSLVADPYAWLVYRLGYRLPFGPLAAVLQTAYFPALVVALPPVFLLSPTGWCPRRAGAGCCSPT